MTEYDSITAIKTEGAPKPGGHYAQGIRNGNLLFVSGQLPVRPDGTPSSDLSFEEQTRIALANMLAVVKDGGSAIDRILKVTAYIVGIENWPLFNSIYAETFGDWRPARSVVPVPALHYGYMIEIEAIASLS
jgi:2-iminobutanoate/2-iminopropanoate deaminase